MELGDPREQSGACRAEGLGGRLWSWLRGPDQLLHPKLGLGPAGLREGQGGEAPTSISSSRLEIDPDPANEMISSVMGKNPITEQIN